MAELGPNRAKKCTRVAPGVIQGSYSIRIEVYQEWYSDLSGVVYEVASGWLDGPIQHRVEAGEGLVWFIRGMQDTGAGTGVLQGAEQRRAFLGLDRGLECQRAGDEA